MPGMKIKIDTKEAKAASDALRHSLSSLGVSAVEDEKQFKKLESRLHSNLSADKTAHAVDGLRSSLKLSRLETAKLHVQTGNYTGALKTMALGADHAAVKLQKSMQRLLKVGLAMGIASITAAAGVAVKQFSEWEVALNRLGNVSDRSLGSMRADILGLSSTLGSATELTKGYYQVLSAGITDADKSMKMLVASAKMSKESTVAQGEVVRGLSSVMDTYSHELTKAADAADLLYTIEALGKTEVSQLIPYIGNLANISKAAGLSANEMGAALAQVTQSGAGTSESVTQLLSLLASLNRRWKDLPVSIRKYGSVVEAVKHLKFEGVLKEIWKATDGNSVALTKMLGRQEGYLALLQLSKNEFSSYGEKLAGMTDKTGAFDDAWKRYAKTLKATWDTFKNTIGKQAVLIGEKLAPKIKEVTERMSTWVEQNEKFITQDISKAIDDTAKSVKDLVAIYNMLPSGSVVAGGAGLLGLILFGPEAAVLIGSLYLVNN